MPSDSKRLPYPEDTRPREIFKTITKKKPLLSKDQKRKDGRKAVDLRPIFLRVGVVSLAKGSAYLELNRTKVLCSVFGPRETTRKQEFSLNGKLNCTFKFAPFSCPIRRQYQPDAEEKELSTILKEALDPVVCLFKYPKSTIDVFILIIENDGSPLSAAITCAGAALADGGIDMYDIVVGSSLKRFGSLCLLDPTLDEENYSENTESNENVGSMTLGWMPSLQQVATLFHNGNFKPDALSKGVQTLIDFGSKTSVVVEQILSKAVKQTTEEYNQDGT